MVADASASAGSSPLDDLTTHFGLINALRTGNIIFDMLVAVAIPMAFGALATVLRETSPRVKELAARLRRRGEVTRTVVYERRVNMWGYSAGAAGSDHSESFP